MREPIIVRITNNTDAPKTLRWLKEPRFIGPRQTIELNYEPWSCAELNQRKDMVAILSGKTITMTLRGIQPNGTYAEFPYDPSALLGGRSTAQPAAIGNTYVKAASPNNSGMEGTFVPSIGINHTAVTEENQTLNALARDGKSHMVLADGSRGLAAKMNIEVSSAAPAGAEVVGGVNKTADGRGWIKSGAPNKGGFPVVSADKTQVKEAEASPEAEPELAPEPAPEPVAEVAEDPEQAFADQLDALTAEKQWAKALQLLIDKYGKDKITFTARAIMSLKTFKAVAEKYKL